MTVGQVFDRRTAFTIRFMLPFRCIFRAVPLRCRSLFRVVLFQCLVFWFRFYGTAFPFDKLTTHSMLTSHTTSPIPSIPRAFRRHFTTYSGSSAGRIARARGSPPAGDRSAASSAGSCR